MDTITGLSFPVISMSKKQRYVHDTEVIKILLQLDYFPMEMFSFIHSLSNFWPQ